MKPDSQSAMPIPAGISSMIDSVGSMPVFGQAGPKKPKQSSGVSSFLSGATLPEKGTQGGKTLTGQ